MNFTHPGQQLAAARKDLGVLRVVRGRSSDRTWGWVTFPR